MDPEPFYLHHSILNVTGGVHSPKAAATSTDSSAIKNLNKCHNGGVCISSSPQTKSNSDLGTNGHQQYNNVVSVSCGNAASTKTGAVAIEMSNFDCNSQNKCNVVAYTNSVNYDSPAKKKHDSDSGDPFYLHNPHKTIYTRVNDVFHPSEDGENRSRKTSNDPNLSCASKSTPTPPCAAKSNYSCKKNNELTVTVEVHSNSSGNGSCSDTSPGSSATNEPGSCKLIDENDYEDIYVIEEKTNNDCCTSRTDTRRDSRDSGRHSRSESMYSNNSSTNNCNSNCNNNNNNNNNGAQIMTSLPPPEKSDSQDDFESGVSSASPSDLGHSEEEQEVSPKGPISLNHRTLPFQQPNSRILKRVVSEPPVVYCPPPPPPLPADLHTKVTYSSSSTASYRQMEPQYNEINDSCNTHRNCDSSHNTDGSKGTTPIYSTGSSSHTTIGSFYLSSSLSSSSQSSTSSTCKNITHSQERETITSPAPNLVNKHLVLPFVPPKFTSMENDSNSLIKPSEYLKSIAASKTTFKLHKYKSEASINKLGNDDDGGGGDDEDHRDNSLSSGNFEFKSYGGDSTRLTSAAGKSNFPTSIKEKSASSRQLCKDLSKSQDLCPPPPPMMPSLMNCKGGGQSSDRKSGAGVDNPSATSASEQQRQQQPQPLRFISTHDLTSVQLRKTDNKAFSKAPPSKSHSVSSLIPTQPFQSQKQDLIAELKLSKDISGIKKLKVEKVRDDELREREKTKELTRQFTVENFVEQIPGTDSTGNPIPPWKRQMLAKKAAEKAKKELDEQLTREAENRRLQSIPPWKRQLMQSKKVDDRVYINNSKETLPNNTEITVNLSLTATAITAAGGAATKSSSSSRTTQLIVTPPPPPAHPSTIIPASEDNVDNKGEKYKQTATETDKTVCGNENEDDDEASAAHIIPWRSQLRKTKSNLNLLE